MILKMSVACFISYVFTLAALGKTDEMDEEQVMEMIFEQFRAHIATNEIKKSLAITNEALQFNSKIQKIYVSTMQRLNCKVEELHNEFDEVIKLYRRERSKVQDRKNKLSEYQRRVQELEQKVKEINNPFVCRKDVCRAQECKQHPHLEKIKQVVIDSNKVEDCTNNITSWDALKTGLDTLLDNNSVVYMQLQEAAELKDVGWLGLTELATLLLCAGLPVSASDSNSFTIMQGAAEGEQLLLVKLLVERGASVDMRGRLDTTPLMSAANEGNLGVIQWLVNAGANITLRDVSGDTALDIAKRRGNVAVVKYLNNLLH